MKLKGQRNEFLSDTRRHILQTEVAAEDELEFLRRFFLEKLFRIARSRESESCIVSIDAQ